MKSGKGMVVPMNQDLKNIRENSGSARDSVLEFNGLWNEHDRRDGHDAHCCKQQLGGECYRDWFSSEVDK